MTSTAPPGRLLERAREAARHSYAPYSGFRVAAAVVAGSGRVYTGVNVENASYGLTVCAERVAIFKAVSEGERVIREVLVYAADSDEPVPPCGACLQVIAEFGGDDTVVYMVSRAGKQARATLKELLPRAFRGGGLRRPDG